MKALWSEGTATFSGKHYTVDQRKVGHPRPHTASHPPILIGGGGKRVLSIAAREADIVGVTANARSGAIGRRPRRPRSARSSASASMDKRRGRRSVRRPGVAVADVHLPDLRRPRLGVRQHGTVVRVHLGGGIEAPLALVGTVDEICDTLATAT